MGCLVWLFNGDRDHLANLEDLDTQQRSVIRKIDGAVDGRVLVSDGDDSCDLSVGAKLCRVDVSSVGLRVPVQYEGNVDFCHLSRCRAVLRGRLHVLWSLDELASVRRRRRGGPQGTRDSG